MIAAVSQEQQTRYVTVIHPQRQQSRRTESAE